MTDVEDAHAVLDRWDELVQAGTAAGLEAPTSLRAAFTETIDAGWLGLDAKATPVARRTAALGLGSAGFRCALPALADLLYHCLLLGHQLAPVRMKRP